MESELFPGFKVSKLIFAGFFFNFRWGELNIASGSTGSYSDQTIMFAAGYLEGALTAG